jgi:cell division protein FtsB
MNVRPLTIVFAALLVSIQYPLWLGQGGWLEVADLSGRIDEQSKRTSLQLQRNAKLAAEVRSLHEGNESVEERARGELYMIKPDEIYVQVLAERPEPQAKPE